MKNEHMAEIARDAFDREKQNDAYLNIVIKDPKNVQCAVLEDCIIALEIIQNFSEELEHEVCVEIVEFIRDIDFGDSVIDILKVLSSLQWRYKIMEMCAFAENQTLSKEELEESIRNRDETKALLQNRIKVLAGVLLN